MSVHWKVQGDWHFDAQYWPDPSAMVREINGLGMKAVVTVWPFSHNGSLSFDKLLANGWLTQTVNTSELEPPSCPPNNRCPPGVVTLPDGLHGGLVDVTYASATTKDVSTQRIHREIIRCPAELSSSAVRCCRGRSDAAMDYVWSMLEDGYYKHGIRSFWLDASEPEYYEIPQWVSATNSASCRRIRQCLQWPH